MRKFLVPALLALLASAALILWIGAFTDIDRALARMMYDLPSHRFPWRDTWFADNFSHGIVKVLLTIAGALIVSLAGFDALRPLAVLPGWHRARLRVVAWSAVLVPLAVSLLKQASASHCPWDLVDFGGAQEYVRLLEAALPHAPLGHCLPAGHASSALWLVSLVVWWLPHRPQRAFCAGACLLIPGFALGWVQQMRGAHFLTHTLWSMWIACAIVGMLYASMLRTAGREPGVSAAYTPQSTS